MGSDNKLVMPAIMILVMVGLLSVAGWLAYVFFDTMGDRPVQSEPFFSVVTSGVRRVRQQPAQTVEKIILTPAQAERETPPSMAPTPVGIYPNIAQTPAVCLDYDAAIVNRGSWNNPLEYDASFSPNGVTITVSIPDDTEGIDSP